uniref:Putative secreted protein n=1 Tax=Anopheles marajoara TaxID=58244 RepID=A0A2M4C9D0_9DIPT
MLLLMLLLLQLCNLFSEFGRWIWLFVRTISWLCCQFIGQNHDVFIRIVVSVEIIPLVRFVLNFGRHVATKESCRTMCHRTHRARMKIPLDRRNR